MAGLWIAAIIISIASSICSEDKLPSLDVPKVSTHGTEYLICFLRKEPPEECTNKTVDISKIPLRVKQLYQRMGMELKEYIVKGSLAIAPSETFSKLHPVIFYLMPNGDKRLRGGGQALARIVRAQGGDTAAIVGAAALLYDSRERDLFLHQLAGVNLPERSQEVLGEYLTEWFTDADADWKYERLSKALKAGNPLLGSLPSPFLTSLSNHTTERFIFSFSRWEPRGLAREEQWSSKGKEVARIWSYMCIKTNYPQELSSWGKRNYDWYTFLLIGFTPDELLKMAVPQREVRARIFQLKFDKLQARAVFDVILGGGTEMRINDLKNGIPIYAVPILTLLSPYQLVHYFNHSITDFRVLNYPSAQAFNEPSLATAKQLTHCLIAQSMYSRSSNSSYQRNGSQVKPEDALTSEASVFNSTSVSIDKSSSLHKSPNVTSKDFINVGHFFYSLQLSYFMNQNFSELSSWQLRQMDSNNLSPRQGRLLTKHLVIQMESDQASSHAENNNGSHATPDKILDFGPGLLRGLFPTSILSALDIRRVPQRVMQHLLITDRPWTNGVPLTETRSLRSLAMLQKVRNEIGQEWVLKHVLNNGDSAQLLQYLTPQEVIEISESILRTSTFQTLSGLHPKTLSVIFDAAIPELILRGPGNGKWASEGLASGATPLLRGLRCNHLNLVDPHDVVVVLGQYNKQRQERLGIKYQPFPKHLQHCAIRSLAYHLKAKAALWDNNGQILNFSNHELLYVLEATDIESVGGYVIAGLPEDVLQFLGADAVRLVGQLRPQELLSALFGKHHPSDIALILLTQLGLGSVTVKDSTSSDKNGPMYKMGRLGSKWMEWSGKGNSLIPHLFGSLTQFLPPDFVNSNDLKWTLETAKPGDSLVCLETHKREHWYSALREAFGDPETWTPSVLAIIGDFLVVVPPEMLQRVPIDSWADAADSLIEKSRYFIRDVEMPKGLENYAEACRKFLPKSEQDSYIGAVKRLARYYLVASQLQLNGITFYADLLKTNLSTNATGRFSQGSLIPVPGLKKPSSQHDNISEDEELVRNERVEDSSLVPKRNASIKITCEAIRASGPGIAGASLLPKDIELMTTQEVWECVDVLGAIDLEDGVIEKVWTKVKYQTDVLELQDLGKIVKTMSEGDLQNFNVSVTSDLDAVFVLGRELPDWKWANTWATKVLPKNLDKPLNVEDVAALGGLLCGIPENTVNQILKPHIIYWAAPFLSSALSASKSKGCPPIQCLRTLGELAADGLGSPSDGWDEMDLADMGILAAGFPEEIWSTLDKTGRNMLTMHGMQLAALECMPKDVLKGLSISQIFELSPVIALGLDEKREMLTEEQKSALRNVTHTPFDDMIFPKLNKVSESKTSEFESDEKDSADDDSAIAATLQVPYFIVLFLGSIIFSLL